MSHDQHTGFSAPEMTSTFHSSLAKNRREMPHLSKLSRSLIWPRVIKHPLPLLIPALPRTLTRDPARGSKKVISGPRHPCALSLSVWVAYSIGTLSGFNFSWVPKSLEVVGSEKPSRIVPNPPRIERAPDRLSTPQQTLYRRILERSRAVTFERQAQLLNDAKCLLSPPLG